MEILARSVELRAVQLALAAVVVRDDFGAEAGHDDDRIRTFLSML